MDHSQTNYITAPLPPPPIALDISQALSPQENPVAELGQTHISLVATPRTRRNRAHQQVISNSKKPRVKCRFCPAMTVAGAISRHETRHCEFNPARVKLICPVCRKKFSRGDSLRRHLDTPTACLGAQPDTPAPRPALPHVSPDNRHISLHDSSPIPESDQNPGSPHTYYTVNDYARDMARRLGSPPLTFSNPSIPRYTTEQPNTVTYNENGGLLPFSRDVHIPQNISEYQYNALVSSPPYSRSWPCEVLPGENTSWHTAYPGAVHAEWADEQLANGQSNNSSLEHMDSQAAASIPRNHEECFLLPKRGFGSQAQHQGTAPRSAQECHGHFLISQPTSHTTSPSRPRMILESPCIGGELTLPANI